MLCLISRALVALALLAGPVAAQSFTLPEIELQNSGPCRQLAIRDRTNAAMIPLGCVDTTSHVLDGSLQSVRAAGNGGMLRQLGAVLGDRMSVANYAGVDPTGAADSTTAFQNAYNAASAGQEILIPPGVYKVGALTGSKWVRWNASGASAAPGASLFNLPGLVSYGFGAPQLVVQSQTSANDLAAFSIRRNTSHSGGTLGSVSSGIRVDHTVGGPGNTGQTNYEWAFTSVMNNWSSAGENVGGYMQCNNYGTGPCWGGLMEVVDKTGNANPTAGLVAQELDLNANGTDVNGNRVISDLVLRRPSGSTGAAAQALAGIRFQGSYDNASSVFNNLVLANPGIQFREGINLSQGLMQSGGSGMRLAANMAILFDAAGTNGLTFGSAFGGMLMTAPGGFGVQGATLGTTAGSSARVANFSGTTSNSDNLYVNLVRKTAGSDWTTAAWRIGRTVDESVRAASIDLTSTGVTLNGTVSLTAPVQLPVMSFTNLPRSAGVGMQAYCSDCREPGQAAGAGTGITVFRGLTGWRSTAGGAAAN